MYLRCPNCSTPMAELRGNELVIRTKHHGEWHEGRFDLTEQFEKALAECVRKALEESRQQTQVPQVP